MKSKNIEPPLLHRLTEEMDTDTPICMVHLKIERSEDIEVLEKGMARNLEDVESKIFTDRQYIKQEGVEIEIENQNDEFINVQYIKQEVQDDVDIERDRFAGGKAIKEELHKEGNLVARHILASVEDLKQEELKASAEKYIKQEEVEIEIHNDNKRFINIQYIKQEVQNGVDIERHRFAGGEAIKEELHEEIGPVARGVLTGEEHVKQEELKPSGENIESKGSKGAAALADAGLRPFKCDICQQRFTHKPNLNQHSRIHTGEKPFECEMCQRRFSQQYHLKRHLRSHTGDKPFECKTCQRRFSAKISLNSHERTHTGDKPYKCETCQRRFNEKRLLNAHLRTHTGDKPFECEICHRRFTTKNKFNSHLRTHTEDKAFECEICHRRFSAKDTLKSHLKTHTGDKPFRV